MMKKLKVIGGWFFFLFFIIELCAGIWLSTHYVATGALGERYFGNDKMMFYCGTIDMEGTVDVED